MLEVLLGGDLAEEVGGDRRVEVDGVVPQTLRGFVALPTPALKGFTHPYLFPVPVLGMILDPVNILISLFAAGYRTSKGLFVSSVHAHGAEDGLRADGTL